MQLTVSNIYLRSQNESCFCTYIDVLAFHCHPSPRWGGGAKAHLVVFRKELLKYWKFRLETSHTSPGTDSTPCVKKLGPMS